MVAHQLTLARAERVYCGGAKIETEQLDTPEQRDGLHKSGQFRKADGNKRRHFSTFGTVEKTIVASTAICTHATLTQSIFVR